MSVINKVLRELDQRHAVGASLEQAGSREVRPVRDSSAGNEWFWRVIALLLVVSLAWVAWVVYQIQPRRVATDLGLAAGENVRRPAPAVVQSKPSAPDPARVEKLSTVDTDSAAGLRLAQSIQTPIAEAEPATGSAVVAAPAAVPRQTKPAPPPAAKSNQQAVAQANAPRVVKHEVNPTPSQRAESEFRRGASFLQQGRVSEAEARFATSIALDPTHEQARQALVALLIEQRRLDEARNLLHEGLRLNPKQQQFAVALARIYVERADYATALEVLSRSRDGALPSAESDAMFGSVLSRMGRDREAVDAYQAALRAAPDKGGTWLGLALSLENLDRRTEAANAYRRALASGTLTADVRQYAEQKIRALR